MQSMSETRVLLVAHENLSNNFYPGSDRSCLVSNCLFRLGGAASIFSNRFMLAGITSHCQ